MRWCIAFLAAACPLLGASWEQKVERAAKLVRARAGEESPFLAADTYLRTAELMRATHPALARQCSMAAVDLLKKVEEPTPNELRAMRLLMSLDPAEGERVALEAGKASAYIAVIDYWLGKGELGRAGERLRQAWRNGVWFRDSARMLRKVREKDLAAAIALYRDLLEILPAEQSYLQALVLAECSRGMATDAPDEAGTGFARLLAAVTSEKFNAGSSEEIVDTFKLGEKRIEATDTRESFLLPLGIYLRKLDPASYERHQGLFAKWKDEIAAVKPEEAERAANPVLTLRASREALPKLRAAQAAQPRPPVEQQKLPFPEAFAKARLASEKIRGFSYYQLLLRTDLTREQSMQAAAELLPLLPAVPLNGPRLSMASTLYRMAVDQEWKGLVRPAAGALTATLRELDGCNTRMCAGQRARGDIARGYETLAAGARRSRVKVRLDDPSFAARIALLDLKDLLDQHHDFQLSSAQGEPFRLMAQRGRVVMLNFWATW